MSLKGRFFLFAAGTISAADIGGLPPDADATAAAMPETGEGCRSCPAPTLAAAPAEKPADSLCAFGV